MTPYARALRRLLEVTSSPRLGLERMARLLELLGDPHRGGRFVHVAGTNGKGSAVAFVDSILRAHGVKTGRTTSPHLTCARERICIGGEPIGEAEFVQLEGRVAKAVARMEDPPTFFERMVAMAFLAFAAAEVEVGIVEVGLGGRLDATNVITPVVAGLTRIGRDHEQWLGQGIETIAREKAGILKSGVPAWSVAQVSQARDAIRAVATEKQVQLRISSPITLPLGLIGAHQRENAGLAVALAGQAWPLSEPLVMRGLRQASWPGRMERVLDVPPLWLDGAHNPDAARALAAALDARCPGPRALVCGMTGGHDDAELGQALAGLAQARFAVQARAPRSVPAERVAELTGGLALGLDEALERALSFAAQSGGAVIVTGSLYLVGEVRARFKEMPTDPDLPSF